VSCSKVAQAGDSIGPTWSVQALGYGKDRPFFWVTPPDADWALHVAFAAPTRALVVAFHAAGGRDNGGPGLRPNYHPNYYGSFALDPDGQNISAIPLSDSRPPRFATSDGVVILLPTYSPGLTTPASRDSRSALPFRCSPRRGSAGRLSGSRPCRRGRSRRACRRFSRCRPRPPVRLCLRLQPYG
jgi:hypothetical protein